jgi:hypothetical protein
MLDAAQVGADVTSVARQPRQPIDASKIREQFLSDFDIGLTSTCCSIRLRAW